MGYIEKNINNIRRRISEAALRTGRTGADVTVIAVSKFVECDKIQRAVDLGLNILAENRVREMNRKLPLINGAVWHIIGHLQTNKVKYAVGKAQLIHSVDSLHLLEEINAQAQKCGIVQDFLLELNISKEESKYGLTNEEFRYIISRLNDLRSVRLRGIMAMAPNFDDKELCRPVFKKAKELFDELRENNKDIDVLSMGMSGDFEIAVEEGATHVRIGSAIFKEQL